MGAGKTKEGIWLCQQSVDLAKKNGDEEIIVYTLDNLSNCYAHVEDFEKSLTYQKEMLKYRFVDENLSNKTAIHQHLGEILIGLKTIRRSPALCDQGHCFCQRNGSNDWLLIVIKTKVPSMKQKEIGRKHCNTTSFIWRLKTLCIGKIMPIR
ncbi:MAG: hypothetical protein IPO65_18495 [Saprospiraceae bacterium]|nr:hypothetical protein [Saprospiraceae bacterium]